MSLHEDVRARHEAQIRHNERMDLPSQLTDPGSIDAWRHTRMLDMARTLWQTYPKARWMTVGDGRYGSDAAHLKAHGVSVLATNLTDDWLRDAHDMGVIDEYRAENAEALSLEDGAVDFVLCKESYHHFPRPPLALYEMLRVARRGVVLIEPIDEPRLLDGFKRLVKRIIRGDTVHDFEPSGNYLYRLSIRELRKLLMAMGARVFAHRGFNDFYHPRLGEYRAGGRNVGSLATRLGLLAQDTLAGARLLGNGLACVVVFTAEPETSVLTALRRDGFRVEHLPQNPYTSAAS